MGVSTVLSQPSTSSRGVTTTQQLSDLEQRIVALGAEKTGVWSVSSITYQATTVLTNTVLTSNKVLHVMHSSDQEDVCYAMTGNGVCVTGDRGLSTILAQLNTFYTQRRSLSVEAKGPRYILGDFVIKPGVVSIGPSSHSIIVEVEYRPCVIAHQCWGLVNQMVAQVIDQPNCRQPLPANHTESSLYTHLHTVQQYLQLFNELRSPSRS